MSNDVNVLLLERAVDTIDRLSFLAEHATSHPAGVDDTCEIHINIIKDCLNTNDLERLNAIMTNAESYASKTEHELGVGHFYNYDILGENDVF